MNDLIDRLGIGFKLSSFTENAGKFLKIFYFYLAFSGIFSFSLFLWEETTQCIEWGGFAASDAGRYDLLKQNCEMLDGIADTMEFINNWFVWMIPPQHFAYKSYIAGTRQYVECIQAEIFANQPILFIGEPVDSVFTYQTYHPAKNGLYVAVNKRVRVVLPGPPAAKSIQITGIARPDPEKSDGIVIDMSGV
jgi:hypothetical protein